MIQRVSKISALGRLAEHISAAAYAHRFGGFLNGQEFPLSSGEGVVLKVIRSQRVYAPVGLRFARYSFATEIEAGSIREIGYGDAETKILAFEKSMAEAVERVLFRILKTRGQGTYSTNGWAAHFDQKQAMQNARDELLERDAVLCHWLAELPMIELRPSSFPKWLSNWASTELTLNPDFNRLRLLVSTKGFIPTVTAVLFNNENGTSVSSHGTAPTLEKASYKALVEACRIAAISRNKKFYQTSLDLAGNEVTAGLSSLSPLDHAMVYAYHRNLPIWLFGKEADWDLHAREWSSRYQNTTNQEIDFNFNEIMISPLCVGYGECPDIQNLFFGTTDQAAKEGRINFSRLNFLGGGGDLNPLPHFIA